MRGRFGVRAPRPGARIDPADQHREPGRQAAASRSARSTYVAFWAVGARCEAPLVLRRSGRCECPLFRRPHARGDGAGSRAVSGLAHLLLYGEPGAPGATARRPLHVARKGYAGHVLILSTLIVKRDSNGYDRRRFYLRCTVSVRYHRSSQFAHRSIAPR